MPAMAIEIECIRQSRDTCTPHLLKYIYRPEVSAAVIALPEVFKLDLIVLLMPEDEQEGRPPTVPAMRVPPPEEEETACVHTAAV